MTPTFSVIIPAHNRRALLPRTLETVFAQTQAAHEVIVVDDGSDDGTAEYVRSQDQRVRLLQQPHQGPGAARNAGAAVASGVYLAFLDSDDLWLPWTLATFAEVIERHLEPSLICGKFVQFAAEDELARHRAVPVRADVFTDYLSSWKQQLAVGAGMVAIRREAFLAVGGFAAGDVNLEDHDLTLKLGTARGFVQVLEPATLGWRRHAGGVTNSVSKSLAGCFMLLEAERRDRYPGGAGRAAARRNIITSHARSVSLECLRAGRVADACRVYLATLWWHLSLGRVKYVLAFPLYALGATFRRS